ncbi:uracil-DNA glycosylase-like protein [Lactarius akahatsu]|uniref:Uracil-DNA glycosylase-like protein n=1 Tax=Lactarius akahatsu TaxID=416441 RepID=A0AAD4LHY5_9AGAM|nr:uracil-DNA glycosylase-like protein [Lactarius akahatsu]
MEDEEKSSFHGSLSRFAYVSLSSFPPCHDQAPQKAQAARPIEEGSNKSSARQATLSRNREGDPERRRTDARSRKRNKLGDAAPDACTHLSGIPDCVAEDLDVLFCGINPGHMSAVTGHHYANPTNHFWHCLHFSAGFTQRLLLPSEDFTLPERYNLGLVNLVDRPSTSQAELSAQEMASSVPALLTKIARFRPHVVCFIGKGIWLHVERALKLKGDAAGTKNAGIREDLTHLSLGARSQGQPAAKTASTSVGETLFCVIPSTSGRVVSHQRDDKVALFKVLREDLERIKAGTLDTGFMRIIHLRADSH